MERAQDHNITTNCLTTLNKQAHLQRYPAGALHTLDMVTIVLKLHNKYMCFPKAYFRRSLSELLSVSFAFADRANCTTIGRPCRTKAFVSESASSAAWTEGRVMKL